MTAHAAMHHSALDLTMNVYADPCPVRRTANYTGQAPACSMWQARRGLCLSSWWRRWACCGDGTAPFGADTRHSESQARGTRNPSGVGPVPFAEIPAGGGQASSRRVRRAADAPKLRHSSE